MLKRSTVFVGLDVHKESISIAYVTARRGEEPTYMGRIGTTSLRKYLDMTLLKSEGARRKKSA